MQHDDDDDDDDLKCNILTNTYKDIVIPKYKYIYIET